jgi:hypothetical protein
VDNFGMEEGQELVMKMSTSWEDDVLERMEERDLKSWDEEDAARVLERRRSVVWDEKKGDAKPFLNRVSSVKSD